MLDTVDFNHVQHISFTQSRLTDAVSVILSELLSYEHPPKAGGVFGGWEHPARAGMGTALGTGLLPRGRPPGGHLSKRPPPKAGGALPAGYTVPEGFAGAAPGSRSFHQGALLHSQLHSMR